MRDTGYCGSFSAPTSWRARNHAHHPSFHHCRSVNDVSYTITGELGKYPVEDHFAQFGMSQFTAPEANTYLYFVTFGEEVSDEFALVFKSCCSIFGCIRISFILVIT